VSQACFSWISHANFVYNRALGKVHLDDILKCCGNSSVLKDKMTMRFTGMLETVVFNVLVKEMSVVWFALLFVLEWFNVMAKEMSVVFFVFVLFLFYSCFILVLFLLFSLLF
jgi:hypothetical protein